MKGRGRGLPALVFALGLALLAPWPAAAGAPVAGDAAAGDAATTVILVRHAEKVTDGSADPPLTPAGEERAKVLAHVLGGLEVAALYSTPSRRTLATAAPLAEALDLATSKTPIEDVGSYVADLAAKIRTEHAGDVVVVVSHSNTVPALVRALGVEEAPEIRDHDYDDLFVVTWAEAGGSRLLHLRYGRPTP